MCAFSSVRGREGGREGQVQLFLPALTMEGGIYIDIDIYKNGDGTTRVVSARRRCAASKERFWF